MTSQQTCIISVSLGTGCYRHVRISAQATLFDLHHAILDAFAFVDDHAHAFFMDNRLWSDVDSFYSDMIEDASHYTTDYTLERIALTVGKTFKYVFDFGEEWVFQCKVLRVLEESTVEAGVVRSKGEPPEQYGSEDEFDDESENEIIELDVPQVYTPAKLKKCYASLGLRPEMIKMLHQYFDAAANLYGIIPLRKLLKIINRQNKNAITETVFSAFVEIVRHEEHSYLILGEDELYCDGKPTALLDKELIEESLLCVDIEDYHEMLRSHADKPYYVPRKEHFLKYADEEYYEAVPQAVALQQFLRKTLKLGSERAEDVFYELLLLAQSIQTTFSEVMEDMTRLGLCFNEDQLEQFVARYQDFYNYTRMPCNRGYTPDELFMLQKPEDRIPKSMSFGPNITAALADGTMDIDELRRSILQMDVPNEQLRTSMLIELAKIQKSSGITPPKTTVEKVGRNALCPCGSGKKYKKCCGR